MADKTEKPTGKRLHEARNRGEVARSLELNSAVALLGGSLLLKAAGPGMVSAIKNILVSSINSLPVSAAPATGASLSATATSISFLRNLIFMDLSQLLPSVGLVIVGLLFMGSTTTLVQTKFLWSGSRLTPKLSHLNPLSGFKRIFSSQGLIQLGRVLLKLGLVVWVAYGFLSSRTQELLILGQQPIIPALNHWVDLASSLALQIGEAYLVLAIIDYVYQRYRFMHSLRMSKEEIKEEMRQSDGDPFIRARIRGKQRQMARMRMMSNVHKASVVITNPTHLAVAIEYTPGQMSAPRVIAKGAYLIAQRIVALARANDIPVIQNIPVARALFRNVQIDQEIPTDLYTALAEILAFVYRQKNHNLVNTLVA